jgi:hypothetical protein
MLGGGDEGKVMGGWLVGVYAGVLDRIDVRAWWVSDDDIYILLFFSYLWLLACVTLKGWNGKQGMMDTKVILYYKRLKEGSKKSRRFQPCTQVPRQAALIFPNKISPTHLPLLKPRSTARVGGTVRSHGTRA